MPGFGSPCGACKYLRRKCIDGCIFAPYFCHEQGAVHFAAIHKVFGASNASKLLAHLPVDDRCEAAASISYEAQARLQDPVYGCVAHIFALQQQVLTLQAELASLQAMQAVSPSAANPLLLLEQQKQYANVYLNHKQAGAQGSFGSSQDVKIVQQMLAGGRKDAGFLPRGSGSDCDPSSSLSYDGLVCSDAPVLSYEGLTFQDQEDLLFSMLQ